MTISSAHLAIKFQKTVLRLIEPVPVYESASESSILSLAAFLVYYFPDISPPEFQTAAPQNNKIDTELAGKNLSLNVIYEPWCDYLSELVRNRNAYLKDGKLCFLIETNSEEYINQFRVQKKDLFEIKTLEGDLEDLKGAEKIEEVFDIEIPRVSFGKKIAVINFSSSVLRTDPFHPKVHLEGLIQGIWFNNQEWKIYKILKKEIPSIQELEELDAVILSGSSLSINDNNENVNKFLENLTIANKNSQKLKILGICFGHQAVTKMFGGKVAKKQWIGGVEEVSFETQSLKELAFFKRKSKINFHLSEYHSDYVVEIPEKFAVIASSKHCEVEAMISDDRRVMSFQFHPEYLSNFVRAYEKRLQSYGGNALFGNIQDQKNFTEEHSQSVNEIRSAIGGFLSC